MAETVIFRTTLGTGTYGIIIEVNGRFVHERKYKSTTLRARDRVEFIQAACRVYLSNHFLGLYTSRCTALAADQVCGWT